MKYLRKKNNTGSDTTIYINEWVKELNRYDFYKKEKFISKLYKYIDKIKDGKWKIVPALENELEFITNEILNNIDEKEVSILIEKLFNTAKYLKTEYYNKR